jgi:hypothetical protein
MVPVMTFYTSIRVQPKGVFVPPLTQEAVGE